MLVEEAGSLIAFASDWLELDSTVEGIRFDAELVSLLYSLPQLLQSAYHLEVAEDVGAAARDQLCLLLVDYYNHPSSTTT